MADPLAINVADGFELEYRVGVPYYAHNKNREGILVANFLRFTATGGSPDYAFNITGNITDKISFVNYVGNVQRTTYADLGVKEDSIFSASDVQDYPITVVCSDTAGGEVQVNGTVKIVNSNIPYFLTYKLYTDTPACFKNIAFFQTGLFGLTVSPRAFYVMQHNDQVKLGLRVHGNPAGNLIISEARKPTWLTRTKPISNDNYWEWQGQVDADRTYDQAFEWEITIKDTISATAFTEYPSIPIYIVVRGKP